MNISSLRHSLVTLFSYSLFILSSLFLLSSSYKWVKLCSDLSARQALESRLELPGKEIYNDAAVVHAVLNPRLCRRTL